jgi:hypothetical protein
MLGMLLYVLIAAVAAVVILWWRFRSTPEAVRSAPVVYQARAVTSSRDDFDATSSALNSASPIRHYQGYLYGAEAAPRYDPPADPSPACDSSSFDSSSCDSSSDSGGGDCGGSDGGGGGCD